MGVRFRLSNRMLGTRLCSGSRLLVNRVSPIQSSFARNAIPKSLPRTQLVLTRAFGGGSVGVQKVITVFGFMGGISIFMALAANALGLNTIYFFYAFWPSVHGCFSESQIWENIKWLVSQTCKRFTHSLPSASSQFFTCFTKYQIIYFRSKLRFDLIKLF